MTNFEELAVYDCRIKPDKADKASTARLLYFIYQDYAHHWEEIESIFSHEAVLKGSFDKYAEAEKGNCGGRLGLVYLLGLLNSKLLRWYFPFVSAPFRGGWLSANRQFLMQLPMISINLGNASEKGRHDQMVALVEQMLSLHKQLSDTKTGHERTVIQRQIDTTDQQVDQLVYELYGLTEEEIKIVEKT